jgi:hypothetical protein
LVKVKLKVLPDTRVELKAPWSAVTVWVTLSLFVQVTLVPTLTVRLFGLKEKFIIETLLPLLAGVVGVGAARVGVGVAVGAVVGVAVGAAVGVVPVPVGAPPHAARVSKRLTANRQNQDFVMMVAMCFCIVVPLLSFYDTYCGRLFATPVPYNTSPGYSPARDRTALLLPGWPPTQEKRSHYSWIVLSAACGTKYKWIRFMLGNTKRGKKNIVVAVINTGRLLHLSYLSGTLPLCN